MNYQNDQQQTEPTPVIGPGICDDIADRLRGNTLVTDLDPLSFFPQETEEDLEKLEGRLEGWYNLISQLGELKSQPTFRIDPFNRVGALYLRIEQYMMLLASPSCTQALKAQYWADVVAAQNSQAEVVPTVAITLTQTEYGENLFLASLAEPGKDPAYTREGDWATCLKFCTQFYRVRRWNCSSWKVIFPKGDPLQFDAVETLGSVLSARVDDQQNEILLERSL